MLIRSAIFSPLVNSGITDTAAIDASLSSYALAEAYYTYLAGLNGLAGNSAG